MLRPYLILFAFASLLIFPACESKSSVKVESNPDASGIKIAYVNGDSILMNYAEFRTASEAMEIKQRQVEDELQKKGAALEREFYTYQQQAQKGTMTGKEMEAREKYLSGKQEALLNERDQKAKAIMEETSEINERLQKVLQDRLKEIKEKEGYDFIMSYIAGGPILVADEKYDITEQVLKELNRSSSSDPAPADTTSAQ